jgi:O-acetyl-ADP-ribose deacetylase (regulator of RNase III)
MKDIIYRKGDATQPQGDGNKIIAHVCNDIGRWGKGFVMALSKRSLLPKQAFDRWYAERQNNDYQMGAVQFVQIEPDLWVANMIGQHKIKVKGDDGLPPVRYEAIDLALSKVGEKALELNATIYMPRIGCGLAGGQWELIEPLIIQNLSANEIGVFVYDWE